jgi:nucleoid-associated protein YgaU
MRDFRLPVALSLIAAFSLAGCAGVPAEGGAASEPAAAAVDAEKKPEAVADRPAVAAAPAERERPAAAAATRDDSVNSTARLVSELNDATRELATLRASNAKLKAMAAQPAATAAAREPDPADAKLAAGFRSYTQFKQELAGFFADVDKLRSENAALNAKLKDATSGSQDVKATLAKLESELRAEKTARAQAEQTTAKLREQLRAVAAAVTAAGLSLDKVPAEGAPTARLETSEARVRSASATTAAAARKHVVKDGDTLERLADRYYGDATKWRAIVDANRSRLPLEGPLPVGLELEIPPK